MARYKPYEIAEKQKLIDLIINEHPTYIPTTDFAKKQREQLSNLSMDTLLYLSLYPKRIHELQNLVNLHEQECANLRPTPS